MFHLSRKIGVLFLTVFVSAAGLASGMPAEAEIEANAVSSSGRLGVIKGVVRDKAGNPIANATVAVFRSGTSKLLKQVTATKSGRFFAKIIPGTYTILAVAQGFNPVTLRQVKVNGASELVYGFNLEKAGSGNTLPEKRPDRLSGRTAVRTAQRSIYQAKEGEVPGEVLATAVVDAPLGGSVDQTEVVREEEKTGGRKGQSVVETYYASGSAGDYAGLNFATLVPVGKNSELVLAGQTGTSTAAPQRFEASFSFRPKYGHNIRLRGSVASLGDVVSDKQRDALGQMSFQALDQWNVREGVILVLGVDYSRFVGAGDDFSIAPRIGFMYDVDPKTRIRSAYTTRTEDQRSWQRVIELESSQVLFRQPVAIEDIPVDGGKPVMNKSSRLEFGVERVLDNRSTIEANVFFDSVAGRGIGFENMPFAGGGDAFEDIVVNQQGSAAGVRVVYNRRINGMFSTSAGYSYGTGQRFSDEPVSSPDDLLERGIFQTVFGQFNADIRSGTSVRTIFRLSPRATVFAIDPFEGRLAIYDPSLSFMVTQELPSWGLPIDAEAILDARNLFDMHFGVSGDDGVLSLKSQRRTLRGGILVRF